MIRWHSQLLVRPSTCVSNPWSRAKASLDIGRVMLTHGRHTDALNTLECGAREVRDLPGEVSDQLRAHVQVAKLVASPGDALARLLQCPPEH